METGAGYKTGDFGSPVETRLGSIHDMQSGFGDAVLRASTSLIGQTSNGYSLYGSASVKLPTADPNKGLGRGEADCGAFLTGSKRFDSVSLWVSGGLILFRRSVLFDTAAGRSNSMEKNDKGIDNPFVGIQGPAMQPVCKNKGGAQMKDSGNFHKKMQEHIDCYAQTDYLTEMGRVREEADTEQAALNWLALSVLHGLDRNVEKIKLTKTADGTVEMTAKYREAKLPAPPAELTDEIIRIIRNITHIEADEGELPLSLGVRDSSVDLKIKMKKGDGKEKITLKFPENR